jgi:hypothetical protein
MAGHVLLIRQENDLAAVGGDVREPVVEFV